MSCSEIDTLPFPSCVTELVIGALAGPTANPIHRARIRNLATGRLAEADATIALDGTVTVTLAAPLQAGHEFALELWDHDVIPAERHALTLCSQTGEAIRLRPVTVYGPDGALESVQTVVLQCPTP